jgi:hypothetical protein
VRQQLDAEAAPDAAHELAWLWLEQINRDILASPPDNHVAYHALSITLVSLVANWLRSQPTAAKGRRLMVHVAALILDGFDLGAQMFNSDHDEDDEYIAPPPRQDEVSIRRRTILPRRRPPRSRPC